MPNQAYFPASEADRVVWLTHFRAKLPLHGPTLGITAEEITTILADIDFYTWILHTWNPSMQQTALEATAYKGIIATGTGADLLPVPTQAQFDQPPAVRPPGVLTRLFNFVQRIKIGAGYDLAIGQDLGIIGSQNTTLHLIPEFTASIERGMAIERVKIVFTKYSHDGVFIECRRNNGAWEFLAIVTGKPWFDERPLLDPNVPEIREYRLRWWDKGEAHGEFSPVQRVIVGP
ncbi:MAG: hypothetical protein PHE55_09320 [Methylococcaceae bacterium]|nr:hypothetical protein [Methylococcaceae bacterium]